MKRSGRRFFSFIRNGAPERYFVWMQFLVLGLLLLTVLYSSFYVLGEFSVASESSGLRAAPVSLELEVLYRAIFWRVILIFTAAFFVNALIGLIFLHRLTGPLVRVEQVLWGVGDGKLPDHTIRFRKGDFLPELCDVLNRMIHACRLTLAKVEPEQKFAQEKSEAGPPNNWI